MLRWLKRGLFVVVVVLLAIGGVSVFHWWQDQALAEWLSGKLTPEEEASRTAAALRLTAASLDGLDDPNVYLFVATSDIDRLAEGLLGEGIPLETPASFKSLELKLTSLRPDDGFLRLLLGIRGELAKPAIRFEGDLDLSVAPSFDGAAIQLVPLSVVPEVRTVTVLGVTDREVLPEVLRVALAPVTKALLSHLTQLSIPVRLGFNDRLDLRRLLPASTELSISSAEVPARLAFSGLVALPSQQGIHVLGQARAIGETEYQATRDALRALSDELADMPPPEPCPRCELATTLVSEYWSCLEESLRCRSERAFGGAQEPTRTLRPVELLVLADLGESEDLGDRDAYAKLSPLLAPRASTEPTEAWTPAGVRALFQDVSREVTERAAALEDPSSPSTAGTRLAVQNAFVASVVNTTAESLRPVTAGLRLPDTEQPFKHKLNTGPAPDLNCADNARGCPSKFEYAGYHPRGCKSNCGTRNCWEVKIGWYKDKKCVNGVDLKCQGRKIDCERLKSQEKASYETKKAAAWAAWKIEKDACEVQKELEKTGCEINQEWLNAMQDMDVGRVEGKGRFRDTEASLSGLRIDLSPDLSRLTLDTRVSGSTEIEASFVFTPLNAGHIACVAPWGDTVKATTRLRPIDLHLEARLDRQASGSADLVFHLAEHKARLQMSPPPGEALLTQAPGMTLACPMPASWLGTVVGVKRGLKIPVELPLIDELELPIPERELRVPLLAESFGTEKLPLRLSIGEEVSRVDLLAPGTVR